jgi:toxin YoeB
VRLVFSERAWGDYLHWKAHDPRLVERINALVRECTRPRSPGSASPSLSRPLSGWWSRRINREHWLVNRASDDALSFAQSR